VLAPSTKGGEMKPDDLAVSGSLRPRRPANVTTRGFDG
jgi:hypothetical protein